MHLAPDSFLVQVCNALLMHFIAQLRVNTIWDFKKRKTKNKQCYSVKLFEQYSNTKIFVTHCITVFLDIFKHFTIFIGKQYQGYCNIGLILENEKKKKTDQYDFFRQGRVVHNSMSNVAIANILEKDQESPYTKKYNHIQPDHLAIGLDPRPPFYFCTVGQRSFFCQAFQAEKSHIQETLTLSTDADRSSNTKKKTFF